MQQIKSAIILETSTRPVLVVGAGLVSKKFIAIIKAILEFIAADQDHGVNCVVLRDDGLPIRTTKDGVKAIMADASMHHGSISVNLKETIAKSLAAVADLKHMSVYTLWWHNMLLNIIHEATHISMMSDAGENAANFLTKILTDPTEEDALEKLVVEASEATLMALGKTIDLEPPAFGEELFFAKNILELLGGKDGEDAEQVRWLNDRIFVNTIDSTSGKANPITNFKGYLHLASGDGVDDPKWNKPLINVEEPVVQTETTIQAPPAAVSPTAPVASGFTAAADNVMMEDDPSVVEGTWSDGADDEMTGAFVPFGAAPGTALPTIPQAPPQSQWVPPAVSSPPQFVQPAAPVQAPAPVAAPPAGTPFSFTGVAPNPHMPQGHHAGPAQAVVHVYPNHNMTPDQIRNIFYGVATKIYNHIFTACKPQGGGQPHEDIMGFGYPEAVSTMPIQLTQDEMKLVVKCDGLNEQGQWQTGRLTSDGRLYGLVAKNTKLPMYKITLNVNGNEMVRALIPQNPNKRNAQGVLKQTASSARQGQAIMYVYEGNDQLKANSVGGGIKSKCVDGRWEIINA